MDFLRVNELGPLYSFDPKIFMPDENEIKEDETILKACQFFLMLAIVYNDLKDLLMIVKNMVNENPKSLDKINRHSGQYGGMYGHIDKLVLSIFCELMENINNSGEILKHRLYLKTINNISKKSKEKWLEIVDIALNVDKNEQKYTNFKALKNLYTRVRHKVGSHYDIKYDYIIKGYKHVFTSMQPNMRCYISTGDKMAQRRFYFADCIVAGIKDISVGSNFRNINYNDIFERINHPIYEIILRFITIRNGSLREEVEQF